MTKSKQTFRNNKKDEEFYKRAKELNVRARSYFKLEQLDLKFNLVKDNMSIIDLGCAPGAWLQYLDRKINNGKIIGIDILELKEIDEFSENVEILEDDFNNIEEYNLEEFDLVLSDMAPEFSGDARLDKGKTHKLNLMSLDFCDKHLKKGGKFAFKTFEGEDLRAVRNKAKKIFNEIKEYKPKSSQKKSAELFIICLNKIN